MRAARLDPARRRIQLLDVALQLAQTDGSSYRELTRAGVAAAAGVSPAAVSYCFGTIPNMRRAVLRHAVRVRCVPVIAQGVVAADADLNGRVDATVMQQVAAWVVRLAGGPPDQR